MAYCASVCRTVYQVQDGKLEINSDGDAELECDGADGTEMVDAVVSNLDPDKKRLHRRERRDPDHEQPFITTAERKALIREIPWRSIPASQKRKFQDAAHAEWSEWKRWGSVRPVSPAESKQIRACARRKRRIMKSRFCYKDKNAGKAVSDMMAKARLTIQGCGDPDLDKLARDSPTVQKVFLHLVLFIAASLDWDIYGLDAKSAFMQGGAAPERAEPIYMEQPRDGIIGDHLPGLLAGQLLEVVGAVYGFINSPRLWYLAFRKKMVSLGWLVHSLDCAVFMRYAKNQATGVLCLVAVMVLHVDDVVLATKAKWVEKEVTAAFEWGQWRRNAFIFNGRDIAKGNEHIALSQKSFIEGLVHTEVPAKRAKESEEDLTPAERTEFKSCTGTAQWLTGASRPDGAAATSLVQDGQPKIRNLIAAQQLLRHFDETKDFELKFRKVDLEKLVWLAYGDSSWANAANFKSQAGRLLFVADASALGPQGGTASLLTWKSHRIRRSYRSTIGAEAGAADAAADEGIFMAKAFAEVMDPHYRATDKHSKSSWIKPVYLITDCRSLFDQLTRLSPPQQVEEKRVAIDICSIRECVPAEHVRWVPTQEQMADNLTKVVDPRVFLDRLDRGIIKLAAYVKESTAKKK